MRGKIAIGIRIPMTSYVGCRDQWIVSRNVNDIPISAIKIKLVSETSGIKLSILKNLPAIRPAMRNLELAQKHLQAHTD